jgi:DNA-binding CsgD family transcriptional regulator
MSVRPEVRSGSAMFVCDRSQRIVAWNDAAERLVGVPRPEAVGKLCWEVIRATDPRGSLVCGSHCFRARLGAHGWPVEPQELDVASDHGRRRVAVDTLTVQDEDALRVVHVLHPAAGGAESGPCKGAPRLTPRQLDVLRLLAEGRPAKEIARQLWLSEATVRNHIRAVLRELESHSQLEALSKARRLGLVA